MADRHAPDNPTITVRPGPDLLAWLASETQRRSISRSALIIEAVEEKRSRESAGT